VSPDSLASFRFSFSTSMKTSLIPSRGRHALCALAALAVAFTASPLRAAEPRTVPSLGLTLMPIPAGTFTMGSPGRNESNRPPTLVTISQPFWLGRTEVTQGQWKALMGTDVVEQVRRQLAEDKLAGKQLSWRDAVNRNVSDPNALVYNTADDAPMYWVSWEEAVAFCRRLTERERAEGRLPAGYEYRLPTDAEWEYAARAGTTTATYAGELEIKGFANASVLDPIAWYRGNSSEDYTGKAVDTSAPEKQFPGGIAEPRAVATKRPNAWGLYDLRGNMWEWCGDWYSPKLPGGSVHDPTCPTVGIITAVGGPGRVIRGGVGIWQLPSQRESALGFRVALAPQLSR
jgi:formylglycine-generating enzyme required for sulfatase activity